MKSVEGRKWVRGYRLKDNVQPASALQVIRNYANAIKAAGGTIFHQGPAVGTKFGEIEDRQILSGMISRGGREVWLLIVNFSDAYTLYCIETEAMKQDIVVNELLDKINKDGFISLYINFDTGKAIIKPDSFAQLDRVAAALKQAGGLKLEVGGHTDNVGTPDSNQTLSDARAKSVMKYLTDKGIVAGRLTAKGYGQSSPVADNRGEEGRAKNRRVELVKK
ncbi:MAG: OmpA family protein [Rhodocyclaceae bacterium]|nr:OmpA family protein [Rhodocyclaceae bacterium]